MWKINNRRACRLDQWERLPSLDTFRPVRADSASFPTAFHNSIAFRLR